jgi:hypothetical protein
MAKTMVVHERTKKSTGERLPTLPMFQVGVARCSRIILSPCHMLSIHIKYINIQDHAVVKLVFTLQRYAKAPAAPRRPKIHVHVRDAAGADKAIDDDFKALSLHYNSSDRLLFAVWKSPRFVLPSISFRVCFALESAKQWIPTVEIAVTHISTSW